MPPTLLIDTNVLLDWLVFRDPRVARLAQAVTAGAVRWIVSQPMLDELEHVLTRDEIVLWKPDQHAIAEVLTRLPVRVDGVATPAQPLLRCADPDDQKFLDLALHERAQGLISRDKALLRLARKALPLGLRIVTPECSYG